MLQTVPAAVDSAWPWTEESRCGCCSMGSVVLEGLCFFYCILSCG